MIEKERFMDILSLHRKGLSIRAIARKLGINRRTVKKYLQNEKFPEYQKGEKRESKLVPYYKVIEDFLKEDNYQATWIHERLKKIGYVGSYDLVKRYCKGIKDQKRRLAYIRFETEPAMQAQVDWGEFMVELANGQTKKLYAFVMVLGYSRGMYVEFVEKSHSEALMDCHINAFKYFMGIPHEILYDNMKTVVAGRENGEVKFTTEFLYFARHYGFSPKACPVYSPWVKGKVERPMNYLRERFFRGYSYSCLEKTNADVIEWLNSTAHQRIHGTHGQKVSVRYEEERVHLSALPEFEYDTSRKFFRPVYKDCQISFNGNRYGVPHEMVGKQVLLKVKKGKISIYFDEKFLVSYQEPAGKGHFLTDPQIYLRLKLDDAMQHKKYGKDKGRAKESEKTGTIEVSARSLKEYEFCLQEGGM